MKPWCAAKCPNCFGHLRLWLEGDAEANPLRWGAGEPLLHSRLLCARSSLPAAVQTWHSVEHVATLQGSLIKQPSKPYTALSDCHPD